MSQLDKRELAELAIKVKSVHDTGHQSKAAVENATAPVFGLLQLSKQIARLQSGFEQKRKGFMARPGHSGMWCYSQETRRKRRYRRMSSKSSVFRVMTVAPTEREVGAINTSEDSSWILRFS